MMKKSHQELSDQELIDQYSYGGDQKALDELISRHYAFIRYGARRFVSNDNDVDDFAAEVVVRAIKRIQRGGLILESGGFGPYLNTVIEHFGYDGIRKRQNSPIRYVDFLELLELGNAVGSWPSDDDGVLIGEFAAKAKEKLDPKTKKIVESKLSGEENHVIQEKHLTSSRSVNGVKQCIYRAMKKFKKYLAEELEKAIESGEVPPATKKTLRGWLIHLS